MPFWRRVGLEGAMWAQVTVQHTPPWSTIWKGSLHCATVRKVHSMSLGYVGAPRHRELLPVGHQGGVSNTNLAMLTNMKSATGWWQSLSNTARTRN